MGMSIVRRRIAGYAKADPRKKKHAPLPQRKRDPDEEMVGEEAVVSRPFMAVSPRPRPEPTLLERARKPILGAVAALVVLGLGLAVFGGFGSSGRTYAEVAREYDRASQAQAATTPRRGAAVAQEYPGNGGAVAPVSLSDRALPTDDSFRASNYVRKKVNLPNISGECVIKGDGARDIGECLRRQGG